MNRINVEFFETYKKLDRLCAQMYGLSGGGVTAYIDDMKANWTAVYGTANWSETFNTLRRLRHMRNEMAHDEGAFDVLDCTREDIDWLNSFYHALMHGDDPISCSRKKATEHYRQAKPPVNNVHYARPSVNNNYYANQPARNARYTAPSDHGKKHHGTGKAIATVIIMLVIFLLALAYYVYRNVFLM